ncbi:MAG TPA: exonuclease domain-containing protein [Candidatus Omnitrophota bacterium]|nr:exonuclease domain-containing protein [Candidatus Omnitrophota bacterium]HPN88521.1 exonuclease domain-containing protein [Candidatus Omnitrophota bacterium]
MKIEKTLLSLDLETTGTWIEKDKIIEIAMVKIFVDGKKEFFEKKVNPQMPIPEIVIDLTGITNEMLKEAPIFKDIAKDVLDFIADSDLAGFNIERFDLPVLERELSLAGQSFSWKTRKIYDAQKIYHLKEKRDLTAAYKFYCDKELQNAHSALADSNAVLDILEAQIKKYGEGQESLTFLDQFDYKSNAEFFDEERKFRWWNGKLYMMFGKYARQQTLQDVAKKDPGYLEWILSADFSEEVKLLVEQALRGKFPEQKK